MRFLVSGSGVMCGLCGMNDIVNAYCVVCEVQTRCMMMFLFVFLLTEYVNAVACCVPYYNAVMVGPAMWQKRIEVDILSETPVANALICSCIYMRKVSDFHLPISQIVLSSTPCNKLRI
jgi:hypothetical protein